MDEIKNDYIEKALNELLPVVGAKEFVGHKKLISFVYSKKVKECIKEIALHLGLPIEVNLSYVPTGYRPNSDDGFKSTHLAKTDWRGRGNEGIIAQVSIPPNLPFYGTSNMVNFPINIRLSENCAENPATLISIMAHELSHIVLYSLWHKEKENEYYTDLTAMMLGFAGVMKMGRKIVKQTQQDDFLSNTITTTTQTTIYGYLSDEHFNFAYDKIAKLLKSYMKRKREMIKQVKTAGKRFATIRNSNTYFQKYLKYVDMHHNQTITSEDGYKILAFHQLGYSDKLLSDLQEIQNELKHHRSFTKTFNYYNEKQISQYEGEIKVFSDKIDCKVTKLQVDGRTLKKYVPLSYKLRAFFEVKAKTFGKV